MRRGALAQAGLESVVDGSKLVIQPDLIFLSCGRAAILAEADIQRVPDPVVEIPSPLTAGRDSGIKRNRVLPIKRRAVPTW